MTITTTYDDLHLTIISHDRSPKSAWEIRVRKDGKAVAQILAKGQQVVSAISSCGEVQDRVNDIVAAAYAIKESKK